MKNELFAGKIELTKLINKLFMYCDQTSMKSLLNEMFNQKNLFDMSSASR